MEVDSSEAAAELGDDLGLPLSRDGQPPAAFPAAAPFSSAVPAILHALRGSVHQNTAIDVLLLVLLLCQMQRTCS